MKIKKHLRLFLTLVLMLAAFATLAITNVVSHHNVACTNKISMSFEGIYALKDGSNKNIDHSDDDEGITLLKGKDKDLDHGDDDEGITLLKGKDKDLDHGDDDEGITLLKGKDKDLDHGDDDEGITLLSSGIVIASF